MKLSLSVIKQFIAEAESYPVGPGRRPYVLGLIHGTEVVRGYQPELRNRLAKYLKLPTIKTRVSR